MIYILTIYFGDYNGHNCSHVFSLTVTIEKIHPLYYSFENHALCNYTITKGVLETQKYINKKLDKIPYFSGILKESSI